MFEKDKFINYEDEDMETITGAIKLALKSLSEPLFTFPLYDEFIEAGSMSAPLHPLLSSFSVTFYSDD